MRAIVDKMRVKAYHGVQRAFYVMMLNCKFQRQVEKENKINSNLDSKEKEIEYYNN